MAKIVALLTALLMAFPVLAATASYNAEPPAEDVIDAASEASEDEGETKGDQTSTPFSEAWENLWVGQQEMIKDIRETAQQLGNNFSLQTDNLAAKLQPFEEEGRRLLVFINTFKGYPQPLEAVMWRISATINELDAALEPVTRSREEASSLLERVNHMATSLPDAVDRAKMSAEMNEYFDSIHRARLRLTGVLTQYDSLIPSLSLVDKLENAKKTLATQLPHLWKDYYLQKPVAWLNPDVWRNLPNHLRYAWQILLMRLPVEMPTTSSQWGAAILRFFIGIAFGGAIAIILKRRWVKPDSSPVVHKIYTQSVPWLVLGSALLGSSISAGGDYFRLFLATGSAATILGEILVSWNLRLLQYPETPIRRSPFLLLLPLAGCAYLLLYLTIPPAVTLLVWTLILVMALAKHKIAKPFSMPKMQLETGVRECAPLILWPCLLLAVSGFQIYSMALYLIFISIAVAWEFSLGGMAFVNRFNEHLPSEGAQAVIIRLGVALAAPLVLILAVIGVCLWVLILPGGTYLLSEYALKGVRIGATQFNIFQILLIISAFYLTRTIVAMGTHYLAKLPSQGAQFDSTLITPMQTALTYVTWAVFALFALHSLGVSLSNLAMVAGGLSVGIGFGMQTIVNNFLSGLILIFGRTLQVGDVIEVAGTTGRVRKISVRSTMVETYDNAIIYVPNSEFMSGKLTNWTSFTRSMRVQILVGVAYGSDTDLVIKLLIEIASAHPNVLKYPKPSVNFADFGASSLDFKLRFWVRDYEVHTSTASDIRLSINKIFNENRIEIAFPQLDVHLKDLPGEPDPAEENTPKPEDASQNKPESGSKDNPEPAQEIPKT